MSSDPRSSPTSPTEHTALEKHACAACGAQAEWSPARQALVCQHCGTVAPTELDRDTGHVREIDLVRTLREMPDELRGWQAAKRSVRCRSCQAVTVFEPERVVSFVARDPAGEPAVPMQPCRLVARDVARRAFLFVGA